MMDIICRFCLENKFFFKLVISFIIKLEDQAGNAVEIPGKEKKALILAMTLHEKGKCALKKEDYAKSLVFFLDADKIFRYLRLN